MDARDVDRRRERATTMTMLTTDAAPRDVWISLDPIAVLIISQEEVSILN
jgi:hypothetical protein